ncbi:MAG: efflux RND transporter permease subunit [Alphaproteobacteria bacterium]|nr:efflux RND transporter permease subunit [Alphaproteobacteria bacterium]MDE1986718.1 efflux RND transporter permease subunit [Alphaproteobacteria bacterium]MDE2162732.1 efflux RND transporter permease subunit [Alphaproteobacteria bacterium]MDE2267003.1 efflux RND transporter permease subunit [Alphaproteobacteria bacterium]MDE2500739.1 efflux RND transporter permease subunit [Alphaproteobacteria bacterium]
MNFTDIFIRRPVLATVISLAILVLGIRALTSLPVRQFPVTQNAVVTVSTAYYGASPETIAGFITTPLENAIAQADGIDYMTSSSTQGQSSITVNLRLNYDASKALAQIITQVNSVKNQMPPQAQQSVISIAVGQSISAMYITFNSKVLPPNKVTDYLLRVVQPQLQAVEGVQQAQIMGAKLFAVRVWLDPQKLAAYGLTASDVYSVLAANNYLSGAGSTRGQMVQVNLTASTNLHSIDEFKDLIIKSQNGAYVRLSDVARVTLGATNYDSQANFDGNPGVVVAINVAPSANVLDVIQRVRAILPGINAQLPQGLTSFVAYDSTKFIQSSITEVEWTLGEAIAIVIFVIFIFLGSPRAVAIPIVTIPLSLIGAGIFMLVFGFTLNLLTLLAFVLAIGLVVDDAIIVVENVSRHLEEGRTAWDAAIMGARELGSPIIAMALVLVAVYVPIGFIGGLTGALFVEFAFTLVGAVIISAIVALTLSPMMSSRLLHSHADTRSPLERRIVTYIDKKFDALHGAYQRLLHSALNELPVVIVFAVIILGSIYMLFTLSKSELAPNEDQGIVIASLTTPPTATLEQSLIWQHQVFEIAKSFPETDHTFQITAPGTNIAGIVLKPWGDRDRSAQTLAPLIQKQFNKVAGVRAAAFLVPSLPGPRGLGVQFVIETTEGFPRLNTVAQSVMDAALKSGSFVYLDSDLKYDEPQTEIVINRDKVAAMGLTMSDVGSSLSAMLGGGYVNYFDLSGRAYQVIPQVEQVDRLNADQLKNYYIRTAAGASIPLSTVAHLEQTVTPESLNHFQQLNAATITAIPRPGMTTGDALAQMQKIAANILPQGYRVDYAGPSRQYVQESSALVVTFFFALVIIFLTLAALFESFRDPIIILISVPMSVCGALIFIAMGVGGASLNIYTEVGLVTLIGLISKHGILIVRFANDLQLLEGKSKRQAIEEAAAIRLRPILMTTAAMVLGVMPLIFASGAGAAARFNLGIVIATGVAIGTCFTLFVVPAMYMLIARTHKQSDHDAPQHA